MNEFEYQELEEATKNFSSSCLIGKGSHGCVYEGILKDGKRVAIKKQSLGLKKLEDNSKLNNEVSILSSLPSNPYSINLVGMSQDSTSNKVLVMEHMPNGTLHDMLHVVPVPPPWPKRVQIVVQIARAVQFLHESKPLIIHRDIKSANILFDSSWNTKLADFGLAVKMGDNSPSQQVHSASLPAGTIGYLDPCYTTPSKLSTKNDIFSFGVVLLEIISCTRAIDVSRDPASIVEWAMQLIDVDEALEICDKRVAMPRYIEGTIRRILEIAALCVSSKEDHRPSIGEVVIEIENCIVFERAWFPIWLNPIRSLILLKRRRKIRTKRQTAAADTTTTIICAAQEHDHIDGTRGKLLVREILGDITLN